MKLSTTAVEPMEKVTVEDVFATFVGSEVILKTIVSAINLTNEKCNLKQLPTIEDYNQCIAKHIESIKTQTVRNSMKQPKDEDIQKVEELVSKYLINKACKHYNLPVDDEINTVF